MSKTAAPRKVGDKEALAIGNTIRGSARKLPTGCGALRDDATPGNRPGETPRDGAGPAVGLLQARSSDRELLTAHAGDNADRRRKGRRRR